MGDGRPDRSGGLCLTKEAPWEGRVMRVGLVGLGTIGQALAKAIDRGEVRQLTRCTVANMEKAQVFAHTLDAVPRGGGLQGLLPAVTCD